MKQELPNNQDQAGNPDQVDKSDTPYGKPTMPIGVAAERYFDPPLSRSRAYDAAARGDIPTLRIGGRIYVKVVEFERLLGIRPAE